MITIDLVVTDDDTRTLWDAVGALAEKLPGIWVLIGGLMVQIHAQEHGFADVRVTRDIDLLAPDGIRPPPTLTTGIKAIAVPGGHQALARSEKVQIAIEGKTFELHRPTLLGAILIKARSLAVHRDPASQREDLLRLLSLVSDPRAIAAELRKTERKWLRSVETRLAFSEPASLDPATVRRARQAYRLLLDAS